MNTLRWAKKQGAITGPAHSASGLTRVIGRVPGATDGPGGLPTFDVPAYDGIGANEFIVDAAHEVPGPDGKPVSAVDFISTMNTSRNAEWTMWYHVLNCGFRVRASGETDFPCITGERVGIGRVYAKVDGELTFEKWILSIADGRSYVSDGATHLMDMSATADDKKYELGLKGERNPHGQCGQSVARLAGRRVLPRQKDGARGTGRQRPAGGEARDAVRRQDPRVDLQRRDRREQLGSGAGRANGTHQSVFRDRGRQTDPGEQGECRVVLGRG